MKRPIKVPMAALLTLVALAMAPHVARGSRLPQADPARVLLEAAMKKEVIDGDLGGAIEQYKKVLSTYHSDRPVVAAALLGMAGCYQKMGSDEAVRLYSEIVREFPDQRKAAVSAQLRLAELGVREPRESSIAPATPRAANVFTGFLGVAGNRGEVNERAQITLFDRQGNVIRKVGNPVPRRGNMAISPDGLRIARAIAGDGLYVTDVATGAEKKLVSDASLNGAAFWSPDSARVGFPSNRSGQNSVYVVPAAGAGNAERLYGPIPDFRGGSWSPDGQYVIYHGEGGPGFDMDLWLLPLAGGSKSRILLRTAAVELGARISPDGRFYAYRSDESRRDEIYVRALNAADPPAPASTTKWKVSTTGGVGMARWRNDGRELYFVDSNGDIMVVDVSPAPDGLVLGPPRLLFTTPSEFRIAGTPGQYADASADGKMFVLMIPIKR